MHEGDGAMEEFMGTIKGQRRLDAKGAAVRFRKAMKGLGTDAESIIELLVTHDNRQRQQVALAYQEMHDKDLIDDLKEELSGHFEEAVVALLTSPSELYASTLKDALEAEVKDERLLVECLLSGLPSEDKGIAECYEQMFKKTLDETMEHELEGELKVLLKCLMTDSREAEDHSKDELKAKQDAKHLQEVSLGNNEGHDLMELLKTRSFPQLQATFHEYEELLQESMEDAVIMSFTGSFKVALLAIVHRIKDSDDFFAEQLKLSMAGAGTNDKALIRLIVGSSEIDLADIKACYKVRYGSSLYDEVRSETAGDYRTLLLAIIGE